MKPSQRRALLTATANALGDEIDDIESEIQTDDIAEDRIVELAEELNALVGGIGRVVKSLIDREEAQGAEILLVPALERHLREDVQPSVEEALSSIGRAEQHEFNLVMARWLSHRPTTTLIRLGSKLNPAALQVGDNAEIGEILARLWHEALAGQGEEVKGALSTLAHLRREGARLPSQRLTEEARRTLEAPLETEEEVEARKTALTLLRFLVEEALLSPEEASKLEITLVLSLLSQSPALEPGDAFVQLLLEALDIGRWNASDEDLEAIREGLANSPWVADRSPEAETVELLAVGALPKAKKRQSPIESKRMTELATEYPEQFELGVAAWLSDFRPGTATAARVLAPFMNRKLPARLASAVERYVEGLDPTGRYRLIAPLIEWPNARKANQTVLHQLGSKKADPEMLASALQERFVHSQNNRDREYVLQLWKVTAPENATARRKLIRTVFIPLAQENTGAYDLAIRYLDLCRNPPHGTKAELLKALGKPPDKKRGKRMAARMQELDLAPPSKKGWLNRLMG